MRRSRWDQTPETEEPIASGSQWNGQCRPNWEQTSRVQGGITSERDHVNTPHPLDYSSESRQRSQNTPNENANASKEKTDSHRKEPVESSGNHTALLPTPSNPWQYNVSNLHLFPGASQNTQIAFPSQLHQSSSWNQPHQSYYNEDYRENIFDMKWFDSQRQVIESHLRVNNVSSHAKEHHPSRSGIWPFGNRAFKHPDRNFDNGRKLNRYQGSSGYDRSKSFRDFRNFSHNSNYNNNKFNKFENNNPFKIDKRQLYTERDPQNSRNIWKYNNNNNNNNREYSEHSRPQDYSRAFVSNTINNNNGTFGKKTNSKVRKQTKNQSKKGTIGKKKKKEKKKNSAAEIARKQTLATAANKLRLSFLAAKKNINKKSAKKSKALSKHIKNASQNKSADISKSNKVPDVSVPKSVPKDGTSLEHDIDIKFSASEWEAVGQGEGGTHNILDVPATSSTKSNEVYLDEDNSDSDSVQTIDDIEYAKISSNNESDNSELSSEEEEEQETWNNEDVISVPGRRRHASETLNVKFEASNNDQPNKRRVRSYSTSQVEHGSPINSCINNTSSLSKNLKTMLMKQLLTMDKKSLLELVDDPKSRKAQFMMNHFMSLHRNVLSQKLNQLRFRTSSMSADEEISELYSYSTPHLESLPSDILDQVKEILDLESKGRVEQMWEEVTLSLSDIFSAISEGNKINKDVTNENLENRREERNELNLRNVPDDIDCQIVTPPPKVPAATITIPDSDNEIHADLCDISGSSICIPQDKNTPPSVSPSISPSLPESDGDCFLKPQDLTHPATSPLHHPDRPLNPVPCSPPSLSHLISPTHHTLKQSPLPTSETPHSLGVQHASPFIPPSPLVDIKRLKLNIKNKTEDNGITNPPPVCNINIQEPPPSIKVKQERPSPMMECGLCMHPPRSPHTQHCGFNFISASPVAMMQGTPRPIGAVPPQRPVPHLASSSIPSIFKQEIQTGTYLNLEHINRPSSEERPKNPAPPDNASSEPPSPLPIPPPQSTLHPPPPPPRPLIFSPEQQFSEPPRPPSPPPPQHSPRIKLERQTPQYICCCMRNECERSNSSRQSADFRRASSTPQGQLCDSGTLRATPHSVYKYEPPYLSSLRTRTPHNNGMINMFSLLSPSTRGIGSSNGGLMQGIVPTHNLNTSSSGDAQINPKVNVAVQTEKATRQFVPNVSFARSVTPLSVKMDQTTSTDDLVTNPPTSPVEKSGNVELPEDWKQIRTIGDASNCFVSTSSVQDDQVNAAINKFTEFKPTGTLFNQLIQLSNQENDILSCIDSIERKVKKFEEERKRLKEVLHKINNCRLQKLNYYQENNTSFCEVTDSEINISKIENVSSLEDVVSNSINEDLEEEKEKRFNDNCLENQYLVTSSQELPVEFKAISPSEYFNLDSRDSQSHSVLRGERCTSTSLPKDVLFPKDSSDSDDDDDSKGIFCIKSKTHKYRLGKSRFRNRKRLNSGSTSDDYQDDKVKEIKETPNQSPSHPIHNENMDDCCYGNESNNMANSSQIKLENVDGEKEPRDDNEFNNGDNSLMKVEDDNICSLTSNRKGSLSCSPQSPKMRNSSGSEHGYSLRSRGPPSDLFDFNSDSQLSKDTLISGQEEQLEIVDKQMAHDDEQADDEFEKEDGELKNSPTKLLSNETYKKRKRKRKTKYMNKCKKKKDGDLFDINQGAASSSSVVDLVTPKKDLQRNNNEEQKMDLNFIPLEEKFELPPPHLAAVLDLKVVGNLIFSSSTDGTARLFDPASGVVLSTYRNHTNSVTAVQVIGEPLFTMGSPGFFVVTGSEDGFIHVYDGKTGVMTQRRNCTEPVRCLGYRWGYLFIGTDGGCGLKWNLKDKKLGEKVQFCGKGIMRLLTHVEGGRKVLVVGAKTTPIMIRDAMSGLFLRTLEYVQLTMYAGVFEGSLLYTGGTDKRIFVYDYCGGNVKDNFYAEASISGLILMENYLIATCYDGFIRIFRLPKGDLLHSIPVESSHKMFICSALFKNKILLGNKNGEIVSCELPALK